MAQSCCRSFPAVFGLFPRSGSFLLLRFHYLRGVSVNFEMFVWTNPDQACEVSAFSQKFHLELMRAYLAVTRVLRSVGGVETFDCTTSGSACDSRNFAKFL